MRHVERLLIAYLLLKPFYMFESGGLQIADLCLLAAFVLYIVLTKFNTNLKQQLTTAIKSNALFVLFVAMTFMVNLTYFAYYGQYKFILSSLYYIFSFLAIVMFAIFCQKDDFLRKMSKAFKFGIVAQVAIFVLGLGRYYSPERYMGTFNDPNQFAFFIFLSYLFIYAIKILRKSNDSITLYLIATTALIFLSASTGMLLGLSVFLALQLIYGLVHFRLQYRTVRHIVYGATSAALLVTVLFFTVSAFTSNTSRADLADGLGAVSIGNRLQEKTAKAEGEAEMTLWEERGYDKIYKYPENTLYGAGEGAYERFEKAASVNELHATLPSILFYYGIVPFLVLLRWIYLKIRHNDPRLLIAIAALFIESFTLLNQRQSLFWVFIILGSAYTYQNSRIGKSKKHDSLAVELPNA